MAAAGGLKTLLASFHRWATRAFATSRLANQPKERSFGQAFSNGSSQSRQSQTFWFDSSGMP